MCDKHVTVVQGRISVAVMPIGSGVVKRWDRTQPLRVSEYRLGDTRILDSSPVTLTFLSQSSATQGSTLSDHVQVCSTSDWSFKIR